MMSSPWFFPFLLFCVPLVIMIARKTPEGIPLDAMTVISTSLFWSMALGIGLGNVLKLMFPVAA